ncbi:MAG: glycoside hydrolase family 127 protein, partial [Phycisphaerales bacterium JB038]
LAKVPAGDLYFDVHHDEDVEIYLNGVLAAKEAGYTTNYTQLAIAAEARETLREGVNHLAVYCKQTNGGQFIDVGIVGIAPRGKKETVRVQPLQPVPFTDVHIEDDFWQQRIATNREVTVPYCFQKCEETGRLSNFAKAGGLMEGEFEGIYFNDSDVYKVIEGACYTLAQEYDKELDLFLDDLIATIAAAQWDDGYLNTYYTLVEPEKRWTFLSRMHELYCAGHLFEAAVAHHQATGKRSLLDVALRFADHIDSIFGPGQRYDVPGHQEIEIGLVKLFHETGRQRYLELAEFFIDQRGDDTHRALYGGYCQDHEPVTAQSEPTGHAVRAMYLYCGMADVAALTGDKGYLEALDRIWDNQTERKLYLTGGIGARHAGEAFGDDYELPNDSAYNETCAAIGNGLWNHRMNLLHADAKYIDVLERVIYNGFLSGVSLEGNTFFYPNPLSSAGSYHRSPWFGCSCCPVNVVRFLPSIAGFVYAQRANTVYANLYVASTARFDLAGEELELVQRTDYPWEGTVELSIDPGRSRRFELALRVPGWAVAQPVPSDLYEYVDGRRSGARITVNGKRARDVDLKNGYAFLERTWKPGDVVGIEMPMPVRTVRSHEAVDADRGRVAFERGPIVYCLEAVDSGGHIRPLWIKPKARLTPEHRPDLLGGVTVLTGSAFAREQEKEGGPVEDVETPITAIPYAVWDHREAGEMAVWIPAGPELAEIVPPPTLASRSKATSSFCHAQDSPKAVNDQLEPKNSNDHDVPRLTWWPHKGTTEWMQLDLPKASRIAGVEVYWFDDTGRGECRLPASWRLLYPTGNDWGVLAEVEAANVVKDGWNRVRFDPIRTDRMRIEVQLRDGYSGGVLEWRLLGE